VRLLVQRVLEAAVAVDGQRLGRVGQGFVVFIGVTHSDTEDQARRLARKLAELRVFSDSAGKTNLSILDVQGSALVVSQFTLYADTRRGRRPSFTDAAAPEPAQALVETFRQALENEGVPTAPGRFGADMQVTLVNDGPFTLLLETEAH